jgi:hypothetical protein
LRPPIVRHRACGAPFAKIDCGEVSQVIACALTHHDSDSNIAKATMVVIHQRKGVTCQTP